MSARERKYPLALRDGLEAAFLRAWRAAGPRQQRAVLDAMMRSLDGQPFDAALFECCIELGDTSALARQRVHDALHNAGDWRAGLN